MRRVFPAHVNASAIHPAHAAPPNDCSGVSQIPLAECNALIALYTSTNNNTWTIVSGWNTTTPCTTPWLGITCSNGHVTRIDLNNNQLVGSVPDLSGLTALQTLDLHNNQLTGTIPALSGWTGLKTLDLHSNQLTGTLPDVPPSLTYLNIANNLLNGTLPASLASTSLNGMDALFLCGTGNVLTPVNDAVNTFIAAHSSDWTGRCAGVVTTPSATVSPSP